MTQEEAIKVLAILKAAYPNSYKGMTESDAKGAAIVWHTHFANLPVEIVMMAVQKCIGESQFPPAVSEVKKKVQTLHWEASEIVNYRPDDYPPQEVQVAKKIYESTKDYRNRVPDAPHLLEMIGTRKNPLLNK